LFTGIIGTLGATFVWENGAHYSFYKLLGLEMGDLYEGPTTPDLEWPTWVVYSAVPLGSWLMCFRFLQVMVSFIRTGELPHHDHGHVEGIDDTHPLPVDANPYALDDALHPHDLKHREHDGESR
ncbi:MAG: TRAP transporter small permease, partial [Rhodocyclaceae bacterium]